MSTREPPAWPSPQDTQRDEQRTPLRVLIGEDAAVKAMKAGAHDFVSKDGLARLAPAIERGLGDAEERRERRRAQEALRVAEEKYRGIFENAVEGIFQTTTAGRFVTVNPMMARIFGYDSPEDMLRTIYDITEQLYVES